LSPGRCIPSRAIVGGPGQLEVHLPLERVHLGYLHFNPVAQLENAPGAPAQKLPAGGIKLIEIVAQPRERHQPAHPQPCHIYKEPEVPHISDQRLVTCRMRGLKLRI
jgi:hypothetical protein